MKIINESGHTSRDTFSIAQRKALEEFEIPKELWAEAKQWHDVRVKISDLMTPNVRGRVTPVRERMSSNSKESTRLQHKSLFHDIIYPRKMHKTSHKKKHLQKEYSEGHISKSLYIELSEVLK